MLATIGAFTVFRYYKQSEMTENTVEDRWEGVCRLYVNATLFNITHLSIPRILHEGGS